MKKTFLCIGAQKAGTTWLDVNLRCHSNIDLPPIKELHFFDDIEKEKNNISRRLMSSHLLDKIWRKTLFTCLKNIIKLNNINQQLWILNYLFIPRNYLSIPIYKKKLEAIRKDSRNVIGEITPAYSILSDETVKQINEIFPDLKIIFILRNPIDREWSQIKMNYLQIYKKSSIKDNIDEIKKFVEKENKRSEYIKTINTWRKYYSNRQFFICFYEDIIHDPLKLLNEVLAFLEVEAMENIPVQKTINKGIKTSIPSEIENLLISKYTENIQDLSLFFKDLKINYPKKWEEDIKHVKNN